MDYESEISNSRVLVVDDDHLVRKLFERNLARLGYNYDSAIDGLQAYEMLKQQEYAVGIYDIIMPKLDGIELLAHTRDLNEDMMVIMTTGMAQVGMVIEALKRGAFAFIRKPFTFDMMHSEIQKALKQRALIIENRNYRRNLELLVEQRTLELQTSKDELALEKEKLESVLEGVGAGLLVVNPEGEIIWKNHFIQDWFGDIKHWGTDAAGQMYETELKCDECQVFKTGKQVRQHFSFKCRDGKVREFQLDCAPVFDPAGRVIRAVSLIQDVTERNKMERELIHTERLASIGEIAASMAHEINNPMQTILGSVQYMLSEMEPDNPYHEDLRIIENETLRTAKVMRSLLEYAREPETQKETIDVLDMWKSSLKFLDYMLKENKIDVVTLSADELPLIWGNQEQLKQVFLNIIINSVNAMPNGGKITFNAYTIVEDKWDKAKLKLKICDNGHGIKTLQLSKVFKPFFTSRGKRGTGLGLSISKRIIESHGGTIELQSELNKGTTCIITLPIHTKTDQFRIETG